MPGWACGPGKLLNGPGSPAASRCRPSVFGEMAMLAVKGAKRILGRCLALAAEPVGPRPHRGPCRWRDWNPRQRLAGLSRRPCRTGIIVATALGGHQLLTADDRILGWSGDLNRLDARE